MLWAMYGNVEANGIFLLSKMIFGRLSATRCTGWGASWRWWKQRKQRSWRWSWATASRWSYAGRPPTFTRWRRHYCNGTGSKSEAFRMLLGFWNRNGRNSHTALWKVRRRMKKLLRKSRLRRCNTMSQLWGVWFAGLRTVGCHLSFQHWITLVHCMALLWTLVQHQAEPKKVPAVALPPMRALMGMEDHSLSFDFPESLLKGLRLPAWAQDARLSEVQMQLVKELVWTSTRRQQRYTK